jgi:single-strand DNA-binding protein
MSLNIVIIGGNLVRDPELRFTPKGTPVADLTVAVNRKWKGDDGEEREEVAFIDCTAFGKRAETIAQYFKKGGQIIVEGYIKQEQWEDRQTGQNRSKLKVMVSGFHFCGRNGGSNNGQHQEQTSRAPVKTARQTAQEATDYDPPPPSDDDVPF